MSLILHSAKYYTPISILTHLKKGPRNRILGDHTLHLVILVIRNPHIVSSRRKIRFLLVISVESILQLWFISCFYLLGIMLFFTDLKRTLWIYLNC